MGFLDSKKKSSKKSSKKNSNPFGDMKIPGIDKTEVEDEEGDEGNDISPTYNSLRPKKRGSSTPDIPTPGNPIKAFISYLMAHLVSGIIVFFLVFFFY